MDCDKVKKYLGLYLDSELSPETTFEISGHLEECESCRRSVAQEERLKKSLRDTLLRPHPADDATWSRAVAETLGTRKRKARIVVVATFTLAVAAGLLLLFGVHHSARKHELDLAAAVANAHIEFLDSEAHSLDVTGSTSSLTAYFRKVLSPMFAVHPLASHVLAGGSVCDLGGVKTAHLIISGFPEEVSVFWMAKTGLREFPETIARMEQESPAFHCRVSPYEFYVRQTDDAVLVGVGKIPAVDLERLVDSLSVPPNGGPVN